MHKIFCNLYNITIFIQTFNFKGLGKRQDGLVR